MLISDLIQKILNDMLEENDGTIEFKRNDIAELSGCVPSQINYVITSRFSKEKGYLVESRRGGGGYIKITRIKFDKASYLMHFLNAVGEEIDFESAKIFLVNLYEADIITGNEMKMLINIMSDNVLKYGSDNPRNSLKLRAVIFKQAVLSLLT